MFTILRDVNGNFCSECGENEPGSPHYCYDIETVSIADVDVAIRTLEDTLLVASDTWDRLHYAPGTRSSAHSRMERWLEDLKRRARVQAYHTNKQAKDA